MKISQHKILLFSTQFCHLCDEAEAMLSNICAIIDCPYEKIDIVDDELLFEQYRNTIPVISHQDQKLLWPFSDADLRAFIVTAHHPVNNSSKSSI